MRKKNLFFCGVLLILGILIIVYANYAKISRYLKMKWRNNEYSLKLIAEVSSDTNLVKFVTYDSPYIDLNEVIYDVDYSPEYFASSNAEDSMDEIEIKYGVSICDDIRKKVLSYLEDKRYTYIVVSPIRSRSLWTTNDFYKLTYIEEEHEDEHYSIYICNYKG